MEISPTQEEFLEQLRDTLAHLFDAVHLQDHPLVTTLVPMEMADPMSRVQVFREMVLQSISDLKPPSSVLPSDPEYRPYLVLRERFVEGYSHEEVQKHLSISRRQYFREQHRAMDALCRLMWERYTSGTSRTVGRSQALWDELEQLGLQSSSFALGEELRQAIESVRGLADKSGVSISITASPTREAFADQTITRQLLVSLLSVLVQHAATPYVEVVLRGEDRWLVMALHKIKATDAAEVDLLLSLPRSLARRMGGQLQVSELEGEVALELRLPAVHENVVMLVEDNPKIVRLFERYLSSHSYRLVAVQDSTAAIEQVRQTNPTVVILDVMMRDVDGWQILQTLKSDPSTEGVRIIVCSILREEALALHLGADLFLQKPVSRLDLITALARVCRD